jgi:hypothetical protein
MGYVLVAYFVANFIVIELAMAGTIHPPWGVLKFFSTTGPIVVSTLILLIQTGGLLAKPRVLCFSWTAVLIALGSLALAALIVIGLYRSAMMSV